MSLSPVEKDIVIHSAFLLEHPEIQVQFKEIANTKGPIEADRWIYEKARQDLVERMIQVKGPVDRANSGHIDFN